IHLQQDIIPTKISMDPIITRTPPSTFSANSSKQEQQIIESPNITLKIGLSPTRSNNNNINNSNENNQQNIKKSTLFTSNDFPLSPLPASQLQGLSTLHCVCCEQPLLITIPTLVK